MTDLAFDINDDFISELPAYQRQLISELQSSGLSDEAIATLWLSRGGAENTAGFGAVSNAQNYFSSLKAEFRKVICGDTQYENLRTQANGIWSTSKIGVASAISAAVAPHVGVAVVVLIPVIALLLSSVAKIGTNAWCGMQAEQKIP